MLTRNVPMIVAAALLLAFSSAPTMAQPIKPSVAVSPDRAQIERGIETYRRSINAADATMGATIFLDSPDTLFIHPRGSERGWSHVAANFYGNTMGDSFTRRELKLTVAPRIMLFRDSAVADFEWDFNATRRDNGKPLHTTGRETQTWVKLPKLGWRIAAVHYSGPPQTTAGQGF